MHYIIAQANKNTNTKPKAPATNAAQVEVPQINNPLKVNTLSGAANKVITILLALIIIAAVIMIIISGFKMMTGGGDPAQLKSAKKGILWAVIGLVVAFMSFAIVAIIQKLL